MSFQNINIFEHGDFADFFTGAPCLLIFHPFRSGKSQKISVLHQQHNGHEFAGAVECAGQVGNIASGRLLIIVQSYGKDHQPIIIIINFVFSLFQRKRRLKLIKHRIIY